MAASNTARSPLPLRTDRRRQGPTSCGSLACLLSSAQGRLSARHDRPASTEMPSADANDLSGFFSGSAYYPCCCPSRLAVVIARGRISCSRTHPTVAMGVLVPRHRDFDSLPAAGCGRGFWIGPAHFGAGLFGCEHPIDAGAGGIALFLPGGGLGDETGVAFDAAVEALSGKNADLDLHHVEPAGMLWDEVELETA